MIMGVLVESVGDGARPAERVRRFDEVGNDALELTDARAAEFGKVTLGVVHRAGQDVDVVPQRVERRSPDDDVI